MIYATKNVTAAQFIKARVTTKIKKKGFSLLVSHCKINSNQFSIFFITYTYNLISSRFMRKLFGIYK